MPANQLRVNELLNTLAGRAGLGSLKLDELGICTFQFGGGMHFVVELPPSAEEVYLMAPLASIPSDVGEAHALFRRALKANYRGVETAGATLTLHESLNHIVLWRCAPVCSLDGSTFVHMVEQFLATALRLAPILDKAGGEPADVTKCELHASSLLNEPQIPEAEGDSEGSIAGDTVSDSDQGTEGARHYMA